MVGFLTNRPPAGGSGAAHARSKVADMEGGRHAFTERSIAPLPRVLRRDLAPLRLQRLQILEQGSLSLLAEVGTVRVTPVGIAGEVRVEPSEARVERHGEFPRLVGPADSPQIVIVGGHVARPQRGALLGIDDAVESGDGTVVKKRGGRPDPVEWRRVVPLDDFQPRLPFSRVPG